MSVRNAWRFTAGMVLALSFAACGDDSLGPAELADPAALSAELAAADEAFNSEAYTSFGAVTASLGSTPAAAAAPMIEATRSAFPRAGSSLYGASALRAQRLRELAPTLSLVPSRGPVIPDALYGRVYRWDTATDQYTWDGAETVPGLTGVRFILYRVDAAGTVVEPVFAVGYADLEDKSTPQSARLQITVKGNGGTPTYVSYLATATPTATSLTVTATGSITNGLSGAANKTLTFDVDFAATPTRVTLAATFALNSPSVTIELTEAATFTQTTITLTVDFRIVRTGEIVRLIGRVTLTYNDTTQEYDVTATIEVRVNGGRVASISGDPETAQWVDAGGEPLGPEDIAALEGLEQAFEDFQSALEAVFTPVENVFSQAP